MKKTCLLVISILFLVLFSSSSLADGGFFRPVYYQEDIYEPTQKGIIVFDGNTEQLIIQATYKGEMDDFAWIIPVPSYPEINKTSSYLFEELHFLTRPNYKRAPDFFFGGVVYASKSMSESSDVNVLEEKQVGIYLVTVLSSEDSKALLNWLNENNYLISQEAESVLDFYVRKRWYFIAMRINLVPYDEKLINSLKNINPSITNPEDAVTILTEDLADYIKSETAYGTLTGIRTTEIDYGEDNEELLDEYRYSRTNKPTFLITQEDYYRIYEQYNGYLENHITAEIQNRIRQKLELETAVPTSWECYGGYGSSANLSRCYIWYFTQDSREYQLLKDVECDKYCSLISKKKDQYTMDDLAKVGANAVVSGDDSVRNYFKLTTEKNNWYENDEDMFNTVQNQIHTRLVESLNVKKTSLVNQLTAELINRYSQQTGSRFNSPYDVEAFFSARTLDDLKQRDVFSVSYIHDFGLLTNQEYTLVKSFFDGDHDESNLRNNIQTAVKNVVYWKQENVQKKLGSGTVQPISIRFKTADIVYPLKISSVNSGVSEVLLYVFAKYRTEVEGIEGFKAEYAGWIETDDIKTDSYYQYMDSIRNQASEKTAYPSYWNPNTYYYLNQLLDDRYFLTKFRKEMWPKEMTDDLLITQAGNNRQYKMTVYEKGYVLGWIGFFIGLAILWAIVFGFCFLPRWINNKIIRKNQESVFYMNIKRCSSYALVIPAIVFFSYIFSGLERLLGKIVEFFANIFEFISHLLNYIGLPKFVNGLIIFILVVTFIFIIIHLISSAIALLYRRIKAK